MNDTLREYMNETVVENDVFEDILNKTSHYRPIEGLEKYYIISEFIEFISSLVNIAAYLFLAITICRFKRLDTRINSYILHLAIQFVVFTTAKVALNFTNIAEEYGLVLEQASTSVFILYLTISLILGLDWFMSGYRPHFIDRYGPFYKYLLAVVYGIALTEYLLTFVYTHMHHMIRMGISSLFYILIILCMIVLNIMKRCVILKSDSAKTVYAFNVSNVIVFSLIPVFVCHTLLHAIDNYILVCINIIPEILFYNHPVIVVYLLGVQNKHFKMAYNKSFQKSIQTYDDEDFIDESDGGNIVEGRTNVDIPADNTYDNNFRQTSYV